MCVKQAIKAIIEKSSSSAPTTFTMYAKEWRQLYTYRGAPCCTINLVAFQKLVFATLGLTESPIGDGPSGYIVGLDYQPTHNPILEMD